MNRVCTGLFVAALALGTVGGIARASPIYGSFSIVGSMTVTENTISWVNPSDDPNLYVIGPPPPSDSFSAVALNSQGAIEDLSLSAQPVGATFSDPGWLTLPVPDANLSITLTYIYAGIYGQSECSAPAAPDQTCTPLDGLGTPGPFNLMNSASGTTSSASFTFMGIVTDGIPADSTPITGQFSVNFTTPYQAVLATLATGPSFSVTQTYSGTFTAVPEPSGVLLALGGFMVGASLLAKRKIAKP